MTNDDIVGALRACHNTKGDRCSRCPAFGKGMQGTCKTKVDLAAAKIIEGYPENTHACILKKKRFFGSVKTVTGVDENGVEHTVKYSDTADSFDLFCSNCGAMLADNFTNFCPKCGAPLEIEGEQTMSVKSDILENADILNGIGLLTLGEGTIGAMKRFCAKSEIGTHRCSVETRFGWCCDLCIEPELLGLNNAGVHTINSCCGHGNNKLAFILVVGEDSIKKMTSMGYHKSKIQVQDKIYAKKMVTYIPKTVFAYQYEEE